MAELHLGVNIDHIATLRQARGTTYPDPIHAAAVSEHAGASGITIHLREDRRHIQDRDVYVLAKTIKTRMNLEMAVTDEMIDIVTKSDLISESNKVDLIAFIQKLTARDLYDAQESYDLLFDRGRALSLLLFEHVHGESRDRG